MTPRTALLLALALAGCGEGSSSPEASERDGAAVQPGVPEPPVPAPAAAADVPQASPMLTAEGWGALRIGMTLAEVVAAAGPDSDPDAVGGPEPESCDQFRPARAPQGMLVMIENGRLSRVSLAREATLTTDRGLGLGATRDQVLAAYGDAAAASPHKYQEAPAAYVTYWQRGGGTGVDYVKDPDARGVVYEIDSSGRVAMIHAGGPSIQYVEGCA